MWFPFITEEDVPASLDGAFLDVEQAIKDASYRVLDELRSARFDVLDSGVNAGHPANEAVTAVIKDATIAQLRFWAGTGDDTGATAQTGGGSILSVSLPGGGGTKSAADKQEARVAPAVAEILHTCDAITWGVGY